jgi:arylsulfatase A-like enzyme
MSRARAVLTIVCGTFVLTPALAACTGTPRPHVTAQGGAGTKPSILLIITDDQRWDTLAVMRNVQSLLVRHGVAFTNSFVSDPLCCPSRASILTGEYAHSTHVYSNEPPYGGFPAFHQDRSTIATWLHAAGYHTGLFGKYLNHYESTRYIPPGWDEWDAFDGAASPYNFYLKYTLNENGRLVRYGNHVVDYSTGVLVRRARAFIERTPGPLFAYFAPFAPHTPDRPARQDMRRAIPLPLYRPASFDEANVSDKPSWVRRLPRLAPAEVAHIDALREHTAQTLQSVDRAVGSLLEALRNTGRLHDTLIVYTSDNGYMYGEHRFVDKIAPYEESIRVPMVVRYDRLISSPRLDPHLIVNIDLAPTFAAAAGVAAPGAEGMDLLPLLRDPEAPWRTDFLIESTNILDVPAYCGVRAERYVYIRYLQTGEQELYDFAADRLELTNVAGDPAHADVVTRLRRRVAVLCRPPPPILPRTGGD